MATLTCGTLPLGWQGKKGREQLEALMMGSQQAELCSFPWRSPTELDGLLCNPQICRPVSPATAFLVLKRAWELTELTAPGRSGSLLSYSEQQYLREGRREDVGHEPAGAGACKRVGKGGISLFIKI